MNAQLSEINLFWITTTAKRMGAPPEALLNVILDHLRQKDQENGQSLPEWIEAAGKDQTLTASLVDELRKTASEVESAVKAGQLYLYLIENNKTENSISTEP